ncbi:TetR family transcriptional regulator [Massilistercora timonensis]|uniref:TetR family transcriptional regulator n=1 Tax=Massilistercora timonensis TaxID=2086584 RepID=UPI003AB1A094
MPKGSEALTNARREEIIEGCARLYETVSFKEITMKEISSAISLTRASIYNYFQTKEEIFLALLQREYERWTARLEKAREDHERMSREEFAGELARSLEERQQLLKLLSMNLYDLEENCRFERLVEFKVVYGRALAEVGNCLEQFFPEMTEEERQDFLYLFFPFLFGVYPYTVVTDKQRRAMDEAGISYRKQTVYEIVYGETRKLLGV